MDPFLHGGINSSAAWFCFHYDSTILNCYHHQLINASVDIMFCLLHHLEEAKNPNTKQIQREA